MSAQGNDNKLLQELKVVPGAVWITAGALLGLWLAVGIPLALHFGALKQKPSDPPAWVMALALTVGALVLLAWILLIAYANFDARRRLMNRTLWTLLVIFIPNAIGFILYFLLRRPLPQRCPHCQEVVLADYVVCPACGQKLVQQCSGCHRASKPEWLNCAYCGAKLG